MRERESYPGKTPEGGAAGTTEKTMPQGRVTELNPAPGGGKTRTIDGPAAPRERDMV